MRDMIKDIWPDWEIEKLLGRGSYGCVYQAVRKDSIVEDHAAIKIISIPSSDAEIDSLRSEGIDGKSARTFFREAVNDCVREIQVMVSLKGLQNIVSVEDYKVVERTDRIGWDIYIRMELLTPLTVFLAGRTLSEKDVIKFGCDICSALEICDRKNIIHRDIKPANIFVNDLGDFKLGDFGVARKLEGITGGLSQIGTPYYMAPEATSSRYYDKRVDIYSLGLVLYSLANNNRLPFLNDRQWLSPSERKNAMDRRLRGDALPPPYNASSGLADVILRACAVDPDRRFSSAAEMKRALMDVNKAAAYPRENDALDQTVLFNIAPPALEMTERLPVSSYGESRKNSNKNSKLPVIIATALATVLLVGAGTLAASFLSGREGNGDKKGDEVEETDDPGLISEITPTPSPTPTPTPEPTPEPVLLEEFTGKTSDYKKVAFSDAYATSEVTYKGVLYGAGKAIDGSWKSSWQENVEGSGIGEYLMLSFDEEQQIDMLCIRPGYAGFFKRNGRPSELEFEFSDGTVLQYSFPDEDRDFYLKFSKSVTTSYVKLTILGAYTGSIWDDTCITEVVAYCQN